jgi:hypothetical protein
VTVGGDDVMVAWDGALLLVLCVAGVVGVASLVCRVFMTGACADFSEPSSEALLCSLEEAVLTRLLVSVSVLDCD